MKRASAILLSVLFLSSLSTEILFAGPRAFKHKSFSARSFQHRQFQHKDFSQRRGVSSLNRDRFTPRSPSLSSSNSPSSFGNRTTRFNSGRKLRNREPNFSNIKMQFHNAEYQHLNFNSR